MFHIVVSRPKASSTASKRSNDEQGTQAVQRALRVLACCRIDRPRVSLTEFAEETGLTMPTAHRIVKALQSRGYLVQNEDTRLYSLGPTVMKLAQVILQRDTQHELIRLAIPHLERLRDASSETATLHCPVGLQRMCMAEVPSRHPVRMANGLGRLYPLYAGAAGKVIMAWSSTATVEQVGAELEAMPNGAELHGRIQRELPRIRKKGYALSLGEIVPNAAAVAAPVFSASGLVAGALSVSGPIDRWNRDLMLDHAPMLTAAGASISATLGYTGAPEPAIP
jgi:IclR family transcriptional regulator, KDG regulon repressor